MRRHLFALLLAFGPAAAPALAQDRSVPAEPYRVEEHGGGLGIFIDQTVAFRPVGNRWIAERTRRYRHFCKVSSGPGQCGPGDDRSHDWIDGVACPQLLEVLRDLSLVTPRRFASPDVTDFWTLSDASLLTVTGHPQAGAPFPGAGIEETLSVTEYAGPYRDWWMKSEKALLGCWKSAAPMVDGAPMKPRLAEQP